MKNIAVIGSGTMGNGIAHVFSLNGYQVSLMDIYDAALDKALQTISINMDRQIKKGIIHHDDKIKALSNITPSTELGTAVDRADLVVEATSEDLEVKKTIFTDLDKYTRKKTLLASNTSSLSIGLLASYTSKPEKVIGMHFMNPVPVMELVEIIRGYSTSDDTVNKIIKISQAIGKTPVVVQDYPGFVANRILMPMINESISALHEKVGGVVEIDTIMKLGMAHPMGPLQLADFIGLDVCLSILEVLYKGFGDPKYAPCPLLVNMVRAGHLGRKSGEGFYIWGTGKDLVVSDKFK